MEHECIWKPTKRFGKIVRYKCSICGERRVTLIQNFSPEVAKQIDEEIQKGK